MARSTDRSRITSKGRVKLLKKGKKKRFIFDAISQKIQRIDLNCAMGILSPENKLFLGSRRLSRIFLSSFSAIISAALPLGQRMMGIAPEQAIRAFFRSCVCVGGGGSTYGLKCLTCSYKYREERCHDCIAD